MQTTHIQMQIYNNLISPIDQAMRRLKKLGSYMIKDVIMFKMASHRVKIIIVPIETKIAINQGQSLLLKPSNKEADTRVTKLGTWDMGMGSFTTKMVECTMGTGVTTKWMDLGLFTTNQEN